MCIEKYMHMRQNFLYQQDHEVKPIVFNSYKIHVTDKIKFLKKRSLGTSRFQFNLCIISLLECLKIQSSFLYPITLLYLMPTKLTLYFITFIKIDIGKIGRTIYFCILFILYIFYVIYFIISILNFIVSNLLYLIYYFII